MIIVREALKQIQTRELDLYHGLKMIEEYKNNRLSASKCGYGNNEGKEAKVMAQGVEDKLKPIISTLRNLDSMTYYPFKVQGNDKLFEGGKDRAEVLDALIDLTKGVQDEK